MRYHDFDAARSEAVREPVAFTLRGERFECLTEAPAAAMFTLAAHGVFTGKAAREFIESVIADEDLERFEKVLANKTDVVSLDEMGDIARWMLGVYTGRPTPPSTGSPDGRQPTGPSSKDDSGNPDSSSDTPGESS